MHVMKIVLKVFKHLLEINTLQQEHLLSVFFLSLSLYYHPGLMQWQKGAILKAHHGFQATDSKRDGQHVSLPLCKSGDKISGLNCQASRFILFLRHQIASKTPN